MYPRFLVNLFSVTGICLSLASAGMSQESCTSSDGATTGTERLTCGTAFSVERETSADLRIMARPGDAPPRMIELEGGAILIDVLPGALPTQVRTAHAIAAVRGTTYVVDAKDGSTAVFVLEGVVEVRKSEDDARILTLTSGEGADIAPETELTSGQWPADRVTALLSRFGR